MAFTISHEAHIVCSSDAEFAEAQDWCAAAGWVVGSSALGVRTDDAAARTIVVAPPGRPFVLTGGKWEAA